MGRHLFGWDKMEVQTCSAASEGVTARLALSLANVQVYLQKTK